MAPLTPVAALLLAAAVGTAAVAAVVLPRRTRRWRSLRATLLVIPVAALLVSVLVVAAASSAMLVDDEQLWLVGGALLAGMVLGLVVGAMLARTLAEDLRRVAGAAARIGAGDVDARTQVQRADEVGALAEAIDDMARALSAAFGERERRARERTRFMAAVSHDLRTPLASLQAAVEALDDGMADDPGRYLAALHRDVRTLSRLVDDLFRLTQLERGDARPRRVDVDLAEVAEEVVEALRPVAEEHRLVLSLSARGDARVHVDPERIARVLRNLLDNALVHAPPGTAVEVVVDGTADAGRDGRRAGRHVQVSVRDGGPGFPSDFLDDAFGHFTRADAARTRGGAGLGLAISRELVAQHGGRIWAQPGPGGCVTFALPTD